MTVRLPVAVIWQWEGVVDGVGDIRGAFSLVAKHFATFQINVRDCI